MRHKMLVPLQLLARGGPPEGAAAAGDMYFDIGEKSIQVFDGEQWGGVKGGNGSDEVYIDPDVPVEPDTELWVDTDARGAGGVGVYLPLVGGELSGGLVVAPAPEVSPAIDVVSGGVRIGGLQVFDDMFAVTKAYCDANHDGGNIGKNTLYATTFGDGVNKSFDILHNLGTENIVFSIWRVQTKDFIDADVKIVDYNKIRVSFALIPPLNGYKVVVIAASNTAEIETDGPYLPLAGGELSGQLKVNWTNDAVPAVDILGEISAGSGRLGHQGRRSFIPWTPVNPEDITTKQYVDGIVTETTMDVIADHTATVPHIALSTAAPAPLGTVAPGAGSAAARDDHVHPMPTANQVGADPAGTASQAVQDHIANTAHVTLSTTAPAALGTAAVGAGTTAAKADHVHQMPTAEQVGAETVGTAAALMDAHLIADDPHPVYLTQTELDTELEGIHQSIDALLGDLSYCGTYNASTRRIDSLSLYAAQFPEYAVGKNFLQVPVAAWNAKHYFLVSVEGVIPDTEDDGINELAGSVTTMYRTSDWIISNGQGALISRDGDINQIVPLMPDEPDAWVHLTYSSRQLLASSVVLEPPLPGAGDGQTVQDAINDIDQALKGHAAANDPHPGYQKESEKGIINGYASLDAAAKVPIVQVPTGTSGTTVAVGNHSHAGVYDPAGTAASTIAAHVGTTDPHTQYQKESEKGTVNGYASLDSTTKVPIAQIPTGATSTTVASGNHTHSNYATSTTQVIAGNGLSGGGTLATDRTLHVGAGNGISVAADIVAVDPAVVQLRADKAQANGYASLDSTTKVPFTQLPAGTTATTVAVGNHNHDTVYLKPAQIVAGSNITVQQTDGSVTISSSAGTGGLDQAAADTRYVNIAGDTMTGNLTMQNAGISIADGHGITWPDGWDIKYHSAFGGKLRISADYFGIEAVGGSLGFGLEFNEWSGLSVNVPSNTSPTTITTNGGRIGGVGAPVEESDAANKGYVDSRIWVGTQTDYDAIPVKDQTVLYCIKK